MPLTREQRLAFETETINRAMQYDLMLFGAVTADAGLVFSWRSGRETLGPQFDDRALAIDWIAPRVVEDVRYGLGNDDEVLEAARAGRWTLVKREIGDTDIWRWLRENDELWPIFGNRDMAIAWMRDRLRPRELNGASRTP